MQSQKDDQGPEQGDVILIFFSQVRPPLFYFLFLTKYMLILRCSKIMKKLARHENLYNLTSQNWHRTSKLFSYEVAEEHLPNENVNKNNII